MENHPTPQAAEPTTTQIGAIGEAVVAFGLILASDGRLAPFKPVADDDGIDLLVFDKLTKRALPVQVKCRTGVDDDDAGTVQFDVRLKTFAPDGNGLVLAVLLDGLAVRTGWLLPVLDFDRIARRTATKLVMVASTKPDSRDRFSAFRHGSLESLASELIRRTSGQEPEPLAG